MSYPAQTAGRQVWTCDDCGRKFIWDEQSYWYGSLRDVDDWDLEKISVYCGCRPMPLVGGER